MNSFLSIWGVSIGILIVTFVLAVLFQRFASRLIKRNSAAIKSDPTNYKFLKHTLTALIYIVGISWALHRIEYFRTIAGSLLAGAGILAVAVGFASQQALGNVISGVFIVVFKPFKIGDRLTVRDTLRGLVEDITLRHTVIRDMENRRIVIPNSVMSSEVIVNADLLDNRVCRFVEIAISYESDIEKARKIMMEEAMAHPTRIDGRSEEQLERGAPELPVKVVLLGDSGVTLRAWVWAPDHQSGFQMHCDLLETIKMRFDSAGIEIPFPHRTIVYKKDIQQKPDETST